jgi:NADH dehydrogenase
MSEQRTVGVAGASGFVGRHVVRELLARGWSVRALVRDRSKATRALGRHERLTMIEGDVESEGTRSELLRCSRACVNCIGIIRETGKTTFQKMHVGVVRDLVATCRGAGVKRFVQISALGVWDEGPAAYQKTKFEGEQVLRRSDLSWTILRPGMILGSGSEFLEMAKGWVRGEKQPWFFLPYFTRGTPISHAPLAALRREAASLQPVAVEDVAWAVGASLDREEAIGEVVNLVGPNVMTWPEFLKTLRDTIPGGKKELEPLGIPAEIAAMQAIAAKKIGVGSLFPFDEGMARMGALESTSEREKARALLGFEPRAIDTVQKAYAAKA